MSESLAFAWQQDMLAETWKNGSREECWASVAILLHVAWTVYAKECKRTNG